MKLLETIHWKKDIDKGLLVTKILIMLALIYTFFVPAQHAAVVALVSNLLWLWRT